MKTLEEQEKWLSCPKWKGFYKYGSNGDDRDHPMTMELNFKNGKIVGTGTDAGGSSTIEGTYDVEKLSFEWVKTYEKESVKYIGTISDDRLHGTWHPVFSPYYQIPKKVFMAALPLHTGKFVLYPDPA